VHDCGGVKFLKKRRKNVQKLQALGWCFEKHDIPYLCGKTDGMSACNQLTAI
jgi:hypothetical protein